MYKIIMAENQQHSIEVVEKAVECARKKVQLIEVVNSGAELISLVQDLRPEIVLINVDLIGINGLEAAKRIRNFDKEVHLILFSEYDYFDFVKEAINARVDEYILKPLHFESLSSSLDKIISLIDEEKEIKVKTDKVQNQLGEVVEFLDYSFIYSILFYGLNETQLKKYKELFAYEDCGYILNVELNSGWEISGVQESEIYKFIKLIMDNKFVGAIGPMILKRIIIFISSKENEDSNRPYELASEIGEQLKHYLKNEVMIGIGSIKKLDEIHVSYEEALRSLRYKGKSNIVHIKDIKKKNSEHKSYYELESKLIENVRLGKEEAVIYFYQIMEIVRPLRCEEKINKLIELFILLTHEARIEARGENEFIDYIHYMEEIKDLSWDEIEGWAHEKLEYIIKVIRTKRNSKKSNAIKEAIEYMQEHYQEEISLDDLSQFIGISPQHLSKLFKEETGINYVEWLTNLRIDMAKQLLTEGNQTVKEICYLVGYHDPNYFSRIFKKIVGISPTDYVSIDDKADKN